MISVRGIFEAAKHSRWYSSDMTVFSCLACFLYAIMAGGNVLNGVVAFIGIFYAHMATNLYDDFDDYKILSKNPRFCEFVPDVKCDYLKNGKSTVWDLLFVIIIYCLIAFLTGVFLFLRAGWPVILLALIGGCIVLSYPKLSRKGLSEIAVAVAFGPLLFEGMYFVMTKSFSVGVLLLSLSIMMFTVGVMYVHTILDFDGDALADKTTIARRTGSKNAAMKGVVVIYTVGYLFLITFSFFSKVYYPLIALISIPAVVILYKSLSVYNSEATYSRNQIYLNVLTAAAKTMALFSFLISIGLFCNLIF